MANRRKPQPKEQLMELKVFVIRDSKAEVFRTPFFQQTHGEAERTFRQIVSDPKSMPSMYPEDFDLYYMGTYNDQNGLISPLDTPQHVLKAVQVKIQQTPNMSVTEASSDPSATVKSLTPN